MPTAAKLISALLFGVLAWVVSGLVIQLLPEGSSPGWLAPVNTLVGALMGWRITGAHAGEGFVSSVGYGLTAIFATTFWAILIWASYEMIERAMSLRYEGPVEALQDMTNIMVEYATLIATTNVVGTMVVGSIICALAAEAAGRRWS